MNGRLPCALCALTALSLAEFSPRLAAAEHEMTMTGCLESTGGGYALATADGRTELTGDADFSKHAGHTVKVTGAHTGTMMTVTKIDHVSPQCDPQKLAVSDTEQAHATGAKGPTADDQGGAPSDRTMTAKIRKAIVDDDSLSMYAHNVKIITRDGKVTLRGPVRSNDEKAAVAAKAEAITGGTVDNQLTVEPGRN